MIRSYINATAKSIKKKIDVDGYGDAVLEEIATDVDCRKMQKNELKQDDKGNEVIEKLEVWLPVNIGHLPTESEITFVDDEHKVISSELVSGIKEDIFLRVHLK